MVSATLSVLVETDVSKNTEACT